MIWFILAIIFVVYLTRHITKMRAEPPKEPARIYGIEKLLQALNALSTKHKVRSTGVFVSYDKTPEGYEIKAWVQIFKIDGEDAADSVDKLRYRIREVKQEIELSKIGDPLEKYEKKRQAVDALIFQYFGTDNPEAVFEDIEDCAYVDERCLQFEATTVVFTSLNQGLAATLNAIRQKAAEINPNMQIEKTSSSSLMRIVF